VARQSHAHRRDDALAHAAAETRLAERSARVGAAGPDANLGLVTAAILLGNPNAQLFWNGARDATVAFRVCFGG
jgi:hypothetical protein